MDNSGKLTILTERNRATRARQLADCRERLCGLVGEWLERIRAPLLDDLESLASGTVEREAQLRYLQLRQYLCEHWSGFSEKVRQELSESPRLSSGNTFQEASIGRAGNLQLLAEEELAEQIVIREFAARLCETCHQEMYGLEQRAAALLDREEPPSGEENPLGPYRICLALNAAICDLADIRDNPELKSLFLRRLEQQLHPCLPDIYHQINEHLARRGILPEIRQVLRRKKPATIADRLQGQSGEAQDRQAEISAEILAAIQQMAQKGGGGEGGGGTGGSAGSGTSGLQDPAFASTLRELQKIDWSSLPADNPAESNLIWRVRHSEAASNVSHIEAATIDIVAMLFDFIFEDKALPPGVKALVGRLQIPVLKIALKDQTFFSNRNHPARYFLDDISGIALRWGGKILGDDPFFVKLETLVTRIQQEFGEDVEVFSQAIDELANFVDERDTEAKPALNAVAETVAQREAENEAQAAARESARNEAWSAAQPWIDKPIYPPIRDFYETHWVRVLESMALDPATTDEEWQDAVVFMKDLAWSISMPARQQRTRLIGLVPRLLAAIQKGLDRIGIPEQDRQPFLDMLYEMHSANLKAAMSGPLPEPEARYLPSPPNESDSHGELVFAYYVSRGIEIEEITLVGKLPLGHEEDKAARALVHALQKGDWIEFRSGTDDAFRAMLKWTSPKKGGLLVFMGSDGGKAISISPDALTIQLRKNESRLIEGESIFERALDGVMTNLKNNPEGNPGHLPAQQAN